MEPRVVAGRVAEFDEDRGIGWVEADGERWRFHCTQIADGTRTIAAGTPVRFEVRPGQRGTWEATRVLVVANRPQDGHLRREADGATLRRRPPPS